jgi:hypothetical protein
MTQLPFIARIPQKQCPRPADNASSANVPCERLQLLSHLIRDGEDHGQAGSSAAEFKLLFSRILPSEDSSCTLNAVESRFLC